MKFGFTSPILCEELQERENQIKILSAKIEKLSNKFEDVIPVMLD